MFYGESDIDYLLKLLGISPMEDFDNLTNDQQILVDEIFQLSYNQIK